MTESGEAKSEEVLTDFIKPMKALSFKIAIESVYGVSARQFGPVADNPLFARIAGAIRSAARTVGENPIERSRPNEFGNDVEPSVIKTMCASGLAAATPRTRQGKDDCRLYAKDRLLAQERL